MKHFSEVYFPFKDQIIKETASMVVEASGSSKGGFFDMFNFFSFFGSSDKPESKMSEQEKARVEARKKMVEAQNQRKKDIAERRDKIAAERIKKAAALRKAQFDQKTRKELAKLDEELAALKRETDMIKKRGDTDIPFTKEELTRLTKQSLNPDTNIPDDQVLMNAHMRAVLFDPETGELRSNIVGEDGKINTEAFHKQLAERAKEYPHLKKQLQNGGVLDEDGKVVQIDWSNPGDNPTFKSLSEFVSKADADIASTQAKLQTAKDTLESSQRSLEAMQDKISKIEEQEQAKANHQSNLEKLKKAKEEFDASKEDIGKMSFEQLVKDCAKPEDAEGLSWDEIQNPDDIEDNDKKKRAQELKEKLTKLGIDKEGYDTLVNCTGDDSNWPDEKSELKTQLEKKIGEVKKKEEKKALEKLRAKAAEISDSDDILNMTIEDTSSIEELETSLNKSINDCDEKIEEICKDGAGEGSSMEYLKNKTLRDNKVKKLQGEVASAETTVGELETANSPEEMMRIMKEEEETIVQMGELGNSDAYRDLKEKINIASKEEKRAPGEIEKDGKIGYIDPAGKFVERPTNLEGDALDEYNNGLNSSLATHPKQEPPKGEESVKVKLDGDELKYYKVDKDGKEVEATEDDYVEQQLNAELRARANKIRDEKLGKVKSVLNKLEVDGEDDETKAKAMEEAIKQLKPEEKALLQAVASSKNPDEILKSAGIKSEDMDKYKQIIEKSGLKQSSTENEPQSGEGETDGNDGDGNKPKDSKNDGEEEFEDGFEIEDEDGVKYIKRDGKYFMKDDDDETEVEFKNWKKAVDDNTDGEANSEDENDDDLEDEADDEESKKRQDPAKVWKHGTYKRGNKTFRTKGYVNKKGDKISAKEYQKKVEAYKKSTKQSNESSSIKANLLEHGSLSYYLRSKLN